jgi:hypothetical protein
MDSARRLCRPHHEQMDSPSAASRAQPWTWDEPRDRLPRPLVDRLLQRFTAQARTLVDLEAQMVEQARLLECLETRVTAQAAELAELREECRLQAGAVRQLRARLTWAEQQAQCSRPWWQRWRRW